MSLGNLNPGHKVFTAPFKGAPHTVELIKHAALESQEKQSVRLLAEEIASNLKSKDSVSEVLAGYYFLLQNARYMNDPRTVELVRAPYVVVEEMARGKKPSLDCDDMVAFLAALMLALGREVQIVTVAFRNAFFRGQRQYSHVFLRVKEPRTSTWIVLDPVAAEKTTGMLRRVVAAKIWPLA